MCSVVLALIVENDAHQTPLSLVEEEDQFADCLELVSEIVECLWLTSLLPKKKSKAYVSLETYACMRTQIHL